MPTDLQFWLQVTVETLTLLIMLVGLIGLVIPIFPGLVVIWLASLGYGLATGFTTRGWVIFALLTLLMLAGNVVDNVLMGAKARQGGASWLSIALGLIGGIVGSLLFPPLGGILGAPLVLFLAEFIRQRQAPKALRSVGALMIGWGWSFIIRFIIGLLMTGLWMFWAWV
ncbi:MAG: DUF456 domain-containing protein [Anaerolineae bacterium]|nr:MAG: DUF456 domain-containing protein [Anaerolineae bacterium]